MKRSSFLLIHFRFVQGENGIISLCPVYQEQPLTYGKNFNR